MIPIKIQCGCGQRYAFDVEGTAELAPDSVACPACGMDGTAAANSVIVQSLASQTATDAAPPAAPRVRLSVPPPTPPAVASTPALAPPPSSRRPRPGQIDPEQAKHEAKAKILWGDTPESVIGYLLVQGFSREEASNLVRQMFREIFIGSGLIAIPIVTTIFFLSIGIINLWIWACTIIVGLSGVWTVLNGIFMIVAPKSQAGDASDND